MVALIVSIFAAVVMVAGVFWYKDRRPVGTPLTWGEAMLAATYVYLLLFMLYAVIPHQWLNWADSELGWRSDKLLVGPEMAFTGGQGILEWALPMTITYQVIRDIVAVGIYVVFLAGNMAMWAMWQNRGSEAVQEEPTSEFGRPLVKEGVSV
ncbi:MAG: hypothetical protein IH940_07175 [Acidobacteria bacterium]|nr:hypothetical protein [Acidobacteriota bacterium]